VVAEAVGDRGHVGGEVDDAAVAVRGGGADAGALDRDEAEAQLDGGRAADRRDLAAGAGGAVEPEHEGPVGHAELGVAQPAGGAAPGHLDGALVAGRVDPAHTGGREGRQRHAHGTIVRGRRASRTKLGGVRQLDVDDPEVLDVLVAALRAGGAVVVPTETVYGLATLPDHQARLLELKGRPGSVPIAVLVADADQAEQAAGRPLPPPARRLADVL